MAGQQNENINEHIFILPADWTGQQNGSIFILLFCHSANFTTPF
jgi:hypothetical protein